MEIDTKQLRLAALAYDGQDTTGQSLAKTLICIADYIDQLKLELEKAREYGKRVSESVVAANRAYDKEFNRAEDLERQLAESMEREANLICRCNESTRREYVAYNQLASARGAEVCYNETISDLRELLSEARAYADKLADSLPEGMLPKDVELKIEYEARREAVCPAVLELIGKEKEYEKR